jgi:predicted aspartyl protease
LNLVREREFILADGTVIKRKVSEYYIILLQGEAHTPVVLGEKDDHPILAVVTLVILSLVSNPFKRILQLIKIHLI